MIRAYASKKKKTLENKTEHNPKSILDMSAIEDGFRALVQAVKLRDIRVIETTSRMATDLCDDVFSGQLQIYTDEMKTRASRFDNETLYCGVRIKIKAAKAEDKPAAVEVYAEYSLIYDIIGDTDFSQESADLFAARNGVFNAWPFFRELAYSSTARMGLPAITVGSFRLPLQGPPPSKQT